jgi:hypothetical protein
MEPAMTTSLHKTDELLSQALLVAEAIEQALRKSNLLATAEGLNKMADLLSSVKCEPPVEPRPHECPEGGTLDSTGAAAGAMPRAGALGAWRPGRRCRPVWAARPAGRPTGPCPGDSR